MSKVYPFLFMNNFIRSINRETFEINLFFLICMLFIFRTAIPFFIFPFIVLFTIYFFYFIVLYRKLLFKNLQYSLHMYSIIIILYAIFIVIFLLSDKKYLSVFIEIVNWSLILFLFLSFTIILKSKNINWQSTLMIIENIFLLSLMCSTNKYFYFLE